MRRAAATLTLLTAALIPAAARAQAPAPTPAAPVQSSMTLAVDRVGGPRRTVLARDRIRVRGAVSIFAANESIVVRFFSRGRKVRVKQVKLLPNAQGQGFFVLGHVASGVGRLVVRAEHAASPALGAFSATAAAITVLPRRVGPGSGRARVRLLQSSLAALGYVVGRRGSYDARTGRAVLAFRKLTGMARTTSASKRVMRRIARGAGRFSIRFPGHGRHVEADLSHQVIALIARGRVQRIYLISSGKPSTPTVVGSFRVYSKQFGTNSHGMLHSSYFIGGYALHGYPSVPVYPASHGCLRVPIPDALSLYNWIVIGTPVDVYS
jgi:hypothetical protein